MIGGIDIHLPTQAGRSALDIAVRAIRQRWPKAVFENGQNGEGFEQYWEIPFGEIEEVFVYRDQNCADAWDQKGAVPELYNTMIHLVADDGAITLVIDERTAVMEEMIAAVESGLGDEIHRLAAEREAA